MIEIGQRLRLRTDPSLGDYSGLEVVVEAGPRGEGASKQWRVSWDAGMWDVDWVNESLLEKSEKI